MKLALLIHIPPYNDGFKRRYTKGELPDYIQSQWELAVQKSVNRALSENELTGLFLNIKTEMWLIGDEE